MARILTLLLLLSVNLLAAYTDNTVTSQIGENGSASLVSFNNNSQHENTVSRQADALNGLKNDLVLASTIKVAKIGAVVGCGQAMVSASNAKNCIVGAVTGGATGALIDHSSGKTQIAQRVELFNLNQLVHNLHKTNDTMEILTTSLTDLLAALDEELEVLSFNRDMGTLSQEAYEKRYSEIHASRTALAESLSLSTSQANLTTNNMENAATRGQTGLEWHFRATK